jgi:beta-lactamase regulating signal transducer with metallopeptidase domain/protocatechuate 3,4-dioxygenase beta subunit
MNVLESFAGFDWQQLSTRLSLTLLHFFWQGVVVWLFAAAALRMFKTSSAKARYWLACGALFCLPVLAIATFALIDVPKEAVEVPVASVVPDGGSVNKLAPAIEYADGPSNATNISSFESPVTSAETAVPFEGGAATGQITSTPAKARTGSQTWGQFQAWFPILSLVYLVGVVVMLGRLLIAIARASRLHSNSRIVNDRTLLDRVAQLAKEMGLRVVPAVYYCEQVVVPAVVGVFKPAILVPVSILTELTPDELSAIISHELAHIRRFDLPLQLVQKVIESLLFFHPAVWWLSRQVNDERENCCDDLAAEAGIGNVGYAAALIHIAEICLPKSKQQGVATLSAKGAGTYQLSRRIERQLKMDRPRSLTPSRNWPRMAIALALVGCLVLAAVFAWPQYSKNVELGVAGEKLESEIVHSASKNTTEGDDVKIPLEEVVWWDAGDGLEAGFLLTSHWPPNQRIPMDSVATYQILVRNKSDEEIEFLGRLVPHENADAPWLVSIDDINEALKTKKFPDDSRAVGGKSHSLEPAYVIKLAPGESALIPGQLGNDELGLVIGEGESEHPQVARFKAGRNCIVQPLQIHVPPPPGGTDLMGLAYTLTKVDREGKPRRELANRRSAEPGGKMVYPRVHLDVGTRTAAAARNAELAAWGKVDKGLQCGIRLINPRKKYRTGDTLEAELLWRNVSEETILTPLPGQLDLIPSIHDAKGNYLNIDFGGRVDLMPIALQFESGAVDSLGVVKIKLVEEGTESPQSNAEPAHISLAPGVYRLSGSGGVSGVDTGSPVAGEIEFEVVDDSDRLNSAKNDDLPLSELVDKFNAENKRLGIGVNQPLLVESEVIDAIKSAVWDKDGRLNEEEFAVLKNIGDTKRLPEGCYFSVHSTRHSEPFIVKNFWHVKLYQPAIGSDGFVPYTIRDTKLPDEIIDPKDVAWGKPNEAGLAIGIYLSPRKANYQLGERVRLRMLVRNTTDKAVGTSWANTTHPMPDDFAITDEAGKPVNVSIGHDGFSHAWISGFYTGGLAPGESHAFHVPFEVRIGKVEEKEANKLVGRLIEAKPNQTLTMKVKGSTGVGLPVDSGSIQFKVVGDKNKATGSAKSGVTADRQAVSLRFLAAEDQQPLKGVTVEVINARNLEESHGSFTTDQTGSISVELSVGFYELRLTAKEAIPWLPIDRHWKNETYASSSKLHLSVTETGIEKWLGKRVVDGYEESVEPGGTPRITYNLLRGCKLVLRAVDVETGKGLAGAEFSSENLYGEVWAQEIVGENIGWKKDAPENINQTDMDGYLKRLVGGTGNYQYWVRKSPPGYEEVSNENVKPEIKYGQESWEHVFKFRKKKLPVGANKTVAFEHHPINLSGKTLDASGEPISGAKVYVVSTLAPKAKDKYRIIAQAISDMDGQYEFENLKLPVAPMEDWGEESRRGTFEIYALAEGHGFAWRPEKSVYNESVKPQPGLTPEEDGTPSFFDSTDTKIELDLKFTKSVTISGKVVDEDGNPIAGAEVDLTSCVRLREAQPPLSSEALDSVFQGAMPKSVTRRISDDDGKFEFTDLPHTAKLGFVTSAKGFGNEGRIAAALTNPALYATKSLITDGIVNFTMRRIREVDVQVLTSDTKQPAEKVMVSVRGNGTGDSNTTNEKGIARLKLPVGEYGNLVLYPRIGTRYFRTSVPTTINVEGDAKSDTVQKETLQIEAACELNVTVIDAKTRKPISDVRLEVDGSEHGWRWWEVETNISHWMDPKTDKDGKLKALVQPGKKEIGIRALALENDYKILESEVEVDCKASQSQDLVIEVEPVTDENSKPSETTTSEEETMSDKILTNESESIFEQAKADPANSTLHPKWFRDWLQLPTTLRTLAMNCVFACREEGYSGLEYERVTKVQHNGISNVVSDLWELHYLSDGKRVAEFVPSSPNKFDSIVDDLFRVFPALAKGETAQWRLPSPRGPITAAIAISTDSPIKIAVTIDSQPDADSVSQMQRWYCEVGNESGYQRDPDEELLEDVDSKGSEWEIDSLPNTVQLLIQRIERNVIGRTTLEEFVSIAQLGSWDAHESGSPQQAAWELSDGFRLVAKVHGGDGLITNRFKEITVTREGDAVWRFHPVDENEQMLTGETDTSLTLDQRSP